MSKKIEPRAPQRPLPHLSQQNARPQPGSIGTGLQPSVQEQTATPKSDQAAKEGQDAGQSTQQNGSRRSFFSKTHLLGAAVLGVAFVSAAVPYSLGLLSPTQDIEVADTEEDTQEQTGKTQNEWPLEGFADTGTDTQTDEHNEYRVVNHVSKIDDSGLPLLDNEWNEEESNFDELSNNFDENVSENELAPQEFDETLPPLDISGDGFIASAADSASQGALESASSSALPTLQTTLPATASLTAPQTQSLPNNHLPKGLTTPQQAAPPLAAHAVVDRDEIVDHRKNRQESRSPYGHSVQNAKRAVDASSYEPATTHPMSENSFSRSNDAFADDPYGEFEPEAAAPDQHAMRTNIQSSELAPRYAAQAFQESDEMERGERITGPAHSQQSQQHENQQLPRQQSRGRQNSGESYQIKYAQIRQGSRALPNNHGQIWCEYDISSFTKAEGVALGSLPEQVLVKWILKQTGEQIWHSEPFGILSATSDTLYVYHTPKVQEVVAQIVDRFVNPHASEEVFTFRIVSLNGPNWLSQAHGFLKPIRIDSPGTRGWLLEKEDHARLIPELSRRTDYKELCSPQFPIRNGREYVVSSSVPRNYVPDAQPQNNVWPGYATETSVIHEGYKLSLIPLLGADGPTADLMIKCESLQIEKMHTVPLNVANVANRVTSRQRITVEAPQVSQFHLDEQIVWPKDKILLLSLGTIPVPAAAQYNDAGNIIPGISRKISGAPAARGHILLIVECRKL